jgi:preprotein translocase subunit SecE
MEKLLHIMAKKPAKQNKRSIKKDAPDSSVVRIRASSASSRKSKTTQGEPLPKAESKLTKTPSISVTTSKLSKVRKLSRPAKATGGYFRGAWTELRQVRWPNRRATWSLTLAVLIYTAFFVVVILLLDALFKYMFELILGK